MMGELARKQIAYNKARMNLELWLTYKGKIAGYVVVQEEAYRRPEATWGHPDSCHHYKLATHYLLFTPDGEWLREVNPELEERAYREAHVYWEELGGAKHIEGDMHHFSFEHNGVR